MRIQIRRLTGQDAPQIAELLKEIGWFETFKGGAKAAPSGRLRSHIGQAHADNRQSALGAESPDGEIVGYGSVRWMPYLFLQGPEGYVSELFVRESARGQGIGRELLKVIETEAKTRGCVRLSLINLRSRESYMRQFYVKAGWEERPEA